MKMKHIFLLVLVGLILSACTSTEDSSKVVKPGKALTEDSSMVVKPGKAFDIKFKVAEVDEVTKLVIKEKNRGCKDTPANKKGCIKVPTANSGKITFGFLSAMPFPCSSHANSWFISKIELANIEGVFDEPVNEWIVKDFGADATNGIVWKKRPVRKSHRSRLLIKTTIVGCCTTRSRLNHVTQAWVRSIAIRGLSTKAAVLFPSNSS